MAYCAVRLSSSTNSSACCLLKLKKAFSELDMMAEQMTKKTTTPKQMSTVATSVADRLVLRILNTKVTGGSEETLSKIYYLSCTIRLRREGRLLYPG